MKKKWLALLISALLLGSITGCQKTAEKQKEETSQEKQGESLQEYSQGDTFIFTDSAGREVSIPKDIQKIAPSGPLAQLVLYTASPDQMCGLAADFSEDAKKYIDEKYWGLPKFGQFYGKNANLNMEALIAEAPDVIVDIGQAKDTIKEDMDALSEQVGIPTVFIEATLPTMADAYQKLGELTGNTDQTDQLSQYCKEIMDKSSHLAASLTDADKKTVYFAQGDEGLNTSAEGSIHSDVIQQIGAVNAASMEASTKGGGNEVSLEQILLWNPDFIIAETQAAYDKITTDSAWKDLNAVKNGTVFKVPSAPYSFISNPPSVNRLIGISWLGSLVYPDLYTDDVRQEIVSFYQLFYHLELSEEDLDEILKNSL